jgi:hypothetical protein
VAHEIVESAITKAMVAYIVSQALQKATTSALEDEFLAAKAQAEAATAADTTATATAKLYTASCGCFPLFTKIKTTKGCAKAPTGKKAKVPSGLVTGAGRLVAAIKNICMSVPSAGLTDKVVVMAEVHVLPAAPGPKRLQALKQYMTKGLSKLSCKSM